MYEKIDRYIKKLIEESSSKASAWNMERVREGKPANWNYIDGCMLNALVTMSDITGDLFYYHFVEKFIDDFVNEEGEIRTYQREKYNLDDINEGRVLFPVYKRTGKRKFLLAIENLKKQLDHQPQTEEGNYWHKLIYPNQVWLDGIYMAQPFRALYAEQFENGDVSDIVKQIRQVREHMYDPKKGLYYHGYDATRSIFWADPKTGCSASFWLRAIGWFATALADIIGIISDSEDKNELCGIFRELMKGIEQYADRDTGMYYQVVDAGGREGNYLETSGSCMIAYAMMKGARMGVLDNSYAVLGRKTFDGIVSEQLTEEENTLGLKGICLVAGLGPENNRRRDGSYEYYISEPVVKNDAKGVAPFVMSYTEVIRQDRQA